MNAKRIHENEFPVIANNKSLRDGKSKLPLSRQVQLASDALVISHLLEVINEVELDAESAKNIDAYKIDAGIQVIEKLKRGEDYLIQQKENLMQRPESVDTVVHIKEGTDLKIGESSDAVMTILLQVKNKSKLLSTIDKNSFKTTKEFLRAVHSGILDELESADDFNSNQHGFK